MRSSYKSALLYTLTDIRFHENGSLVGHEWIHPHEDKIKMDLDFIAIRFARYYWDVVMSGIRDMSERIANEDIPLQDANMIELIKQELKNHNKIPSLNKLASTKMSTFRKNVIRGSLKDAEVFKNLLKNFNGLFTKQVGENYIMFDPNLIIFMKKHHNYIRDKLEDKIEKHLKKINKNYLPTKTYITRDSPFYKYLANFNQKLFVMGMNHEESLVDYKKTMDKKISLQHLGADCDIQKPVCVWGLRSTDENKKIWDTINKNDLILFSRNGVCHSKGRVLATLQDKCLTNLWTDIEGTPRDLLVVFDEIMDFELQLDSVQPPLINPTMPDQYFFPIIPVPDEIINRWYTVYGNLEVALDSMSSNLGYPVSDHVVKLKKGYMNIRLNQGRFRNQVLENYRFKCAVCEISDMDLLEAAHVVPVSYEDTSGDIDNGICLCVLHHKMMDKKFLYFDDDYNVRFTDKSNSAHLKDTLTILNVSHSCNLPPSKENLSDYRTLMGLP